MKEMFINIGKNPRYRARLEEIEAELRAEDAEEEA
jgi:hypothetical protein